VTSDVDPLDWKQVYGQVTVSDELLRREPSDWDRQLSRAFTLERHLEDLSDAVRYSDLVDKMKLEAVAGARECGATWPQVAEVLGISHQGARSTWARRVKALQKETPD
jgi:hypothetical protein